ncbi:Uncharacterised protein [Mycobacteroides abscessus]|nr:Uncharacterised protein [Mycobacteroides abscessus]
MRTNSSGVCRANSSVYSTSRTASRPVAASSSTRSAMPVMSSGALSGRCTADGCGWNVTATARASRSRARSTMRPSTWACPRWTPSKLPIVTTDGPKPGGTWLRSVHRCTRELLR